MSSTDAERPQGSLRTAGARAMRWQTLSTLVVQVVQAGVTLAVAAVVGPAEFALWGVASVLLNARVLFSLGLGEALIYLDADRRYRDLVDAAFVISGAIALATAALLVAFAPQIAGLFDTGFDQDDVALAIQVTAFALACATLENIPLATIERRLDFRRRALTEITTSVAYATVALGLLAGGAGVWSIIAARVALSAARLAGFWAVAPVKPRIPPGATRDAARRLLSYGGLLGVAATLGFLAENLDTVLVGALGTADVLGAYALAFTIASLLPTFLGFTVARVANPLYAAVRGEPERLREAFATTLHFVGLIVLPAAAAFATFAPEALVELLGDEWAPAQPFLRILAVYALARAIGDAAMNLLAVTGGARRSLIGRAAGLGVTIALVWPLEKALDTEGIVWAFAAGRIVVALYGLWAARHALSSRLARLAGPLAATTVATAVGGAVWLLAPGEWRGVLATVALAVSYPLLVWALDPWVRANGLTLLRPGRAG